MLGAGSMLLATQTGDRIESSAKKSYVYKTYLKDDDITIKTTDKNVVILTGSVADWSHRSLAEQTVAGLPGVLRVDNKLEVKGDKIEENSDAWLKMKVKTMLLFYSNVSSINTEVEVKDGIVTLRGEAESEAQKELTTEYIKDLEGVQSVTNNLTVKNGKKSTAEKISDKIDDASITAQVKIALLFHRSTSATAITVVTKNGIVTVSGLAKNDAEKALVGKLVHNIKGVKSLKNEIKID
ncbi:MAG: hypothetical protein A2293_08580 [Elusimicrobia bacterium RIFOXYB2_FULL_49_7]|nr:MAG: hypothetical protein A2293_08580 [Elusimicrobia bacterium RIFOXYB2_FULL_49_7]